jgi:hypothetical protein
MQKMDDTQRRQFDDLVKAAITLFVMSGEEAYRMTITHKDNPELRPSEMVVLTIVRKHRPECGDRNCPVYDYAGAIGYVTA